MAPLVASHGIGCGEPELRSCADSLGRHGSARAVLHQTLIVRAGSKHGFSFTPAFA